MCDDRGILMTVSKQDQICFEMPLLPVFTGKSGGVLLIPTRLSSQILTCGETYGYVFSRKIGGTISDFHRVFRFLVSKSYHESTVKL